MSKVEFPKALFDKVRSGNVVLCTGVRLAAAASMPTWEELLGSLADKLKDASEVKALIEAHKLLPAAGYLSRNLDEKVIAEVIKNAYGKDDKPSATHKWLHQIPFHAAISTGYDNLLEEALRDKEEPKVFSHRDGAKLRIAEDLKHYVVKAHGDVDHLDDLILSATGFKRKIASNQPYRAFLEDLYRSSTLLFVGYRSFDPDFVLFMERLVSTFRDAVTDHYAILPSVSEIEKDELYANYRLKVISYEPGDDQVKALAEVLQSFKEGFKAAGGKSEAVSDPIDWLETHLSPVSLRIDVVSEKGLTLTQARLQRINDESAKIDLTKLSPQALCRLGNVRMYLGETSSAVECYQAALNIDEKMAQAHLNLHHALAEIGNFDQALAHIKSAEKLDDSTRIVPKDYELKAIIGRGSTGTVYQGYDHKKKRDVTIKVLKASSVKEHLSSDLWLEESESIKKLSHKHVAKIYDTLVDGGRCIQIAEPLKGQSLSRRIREKGALGVEEAQKVMSEVIEGLAFAHKAGVFHLDIMPGNIFIREDGSVALMDFRPGRAHKGRTIAKSEEGEGYRAPELASGQEVDHRSDIFSLGATLYTMLSAKKPIGSFPKLAEVNASAKRFESLVNRSLKANQEERLHSLDEFKKLLLSSEGVSVPTAKDDLIGWLEVLAYQPDHAEAQKTIKNLEADYRKKKDWDNLVTLLLGRVEIESDPAKRQKIMRDVAGIFEQDGDAEKAMTALMAGLKEDPENIEIQKDIERIAESANLWSDVVSEYSNIAQHVRDPKLAADWWVNIGGLYADKVKHEDYAIAAYNHAISLEATRSDALSALCDIYKAKEEYKEVAKLLTKMARAEEDNTQKNQLLFELAKLHQDKLKSPEEAILNYRKVLENNPKHRESNNALVELYQNSKMWNELAELLNTQIAKSDVAEDILHYRHVLAQLYTDELDKEEEAIKILAKILDETPNDAKALLTLERLYGKTNRQKEYLEILDKRIKAAKDDAEKATLYRRLAEESEKQPGGLSRAAEYLVEIHKLGKASEDNYRSLVKIYWELKEYKKLVDAYDWHIKVAEKPKDRSILYAALARVYDEHLKDNDKAIEAYTHVLKDDEKSLIALKALSRLHQEKKNWKETVSLTGRLVKELSDNAEKAESFYQLGEIQYKELKKLDDAEKSLVKAIEFNGEHLPSLKLLGELYLERKDHGKAARFTHDAAKATQNQLDKIELLFSAAETYRKELDDKERALNLYMQLLELDPEHIDAAHYAAEILIDRDAHQAALPYCEALVRKTDPKDRKLLFERNLMLGKVALTAEDSKKALNAYRAAHKIDPVNHEVLKNLATLLHDEGNYQEAGKHFQALLVHKRDSMKGDEIIDIFFRLSDIKEKQNEPAKALNMIEKALDVDPTNQQVLERAIAIYEKKNDFDAVMRSKQNMLKALKDDKEKFKLLEEIGDLQAKKVKKPADAIKSYIQALEIDSKSRRVLNKQMEVHVELGQWEDAIKIIRKLVDGEDDAKHRYRLHHTAALILLDKLKRPKDAAEAFDLALQNEPTNMASFEALRKLYSEQKEYRKLLRAYRLLLKRLPEDTPKEKRVELWKEVADLAHKELKDGKESIIAFEMISKLDPKASAHDDILASLYASAGPDAYEKAVSVNQRILNRDPMNKAAYHELYRLYSAMGYDDKAFCLSSVLSLLKIATKEERVLFDRYQGVRSKDVPRAAAKLSDDALWKDLIYHPDQTPVITDVLSIVLPLFAPMAVQSRDDLKLKNEVQLQLQEDERRYARVFQYISDVLEQAPTELYLRPSKEQLKLSMVEEDDQQKAEVLFVDPSILEKDERELSFQFARTLSLMRSEHKVLYISATPTVVRALMLACIKLTNPDFKVDGDVEIINRLADAFYDQLPASHIDAIAKRYDELVAKVKNGNAEQWMRAVELSIDRAGLLLCDDIATALRMAASTEPLAIEEGLTTQDRVAHLFRYAASENFFTARKHLGLDKKF